MTARLLALCLALLQVLPSLCAVTMETECSPGAGALVTESCCGGGQAAPLDCSGPSPASGDCSIQHTCPLCAVVCCESRPAPLERKEQRREQGRPLGPEVLFAQGSYPAPAAAPGAEIPQRQAAHDDGWMVVGDDLRAITNAWVI